MMNNNYYVDCYRYKIFSGDEIRENPDLLNILTYKEVKFAESFLREFGNNINWCSVCDEQELSLNFIREHKDILNFWEWISYISSNINFSLKQIEEFKNYLDWKIISQRKDLTEEFIRKYIDRIYWIDISSNPNLSDQFYKEYKDNIHWNIAITVHKFPEDLLLEFREELEEQEMWETISLYQDLSDEFMNKYGIIKSFKGLLSSTNFTPYEITDRYYDKKVIE